MGYGDLREFVKRLDKEGELHRIKAEVDPVLEISEIVQRAQAQPGVNGKPGGKALLFERPTVNGAVCATAAGAGSAPGARRAA